jgi:cysteinyl-tRNA synthetase
MPTLSVYNTLSMQKEPFQTISPNKVRMFVCGPTVQGLIHVGHARTYIFYDALARYLSHLGYEVNFLMNITDIDDRITQNAKAEGIGPETFAERYAKAFLEDMTRLKILTVTSFERVSGYVSEMINQVSTLVSSGHAYVVGGDVYFDTSTFPDFGKLSHQSRAELMMRPVEISPKKRGMLDFALWRSLSLVDGKWRSPWGVGSPGWHIQDTAASVTNLGPQYDIHGGAYELIYPHHESEIAQVESLTGLKPFVRYWVHTGLLTMKGSKMSKSEGNVFNVRDVLRNHGSDELRFYLLSNHYRKDVEFDDKKLKKCGERYLQVKKGAKTIEERRSARARRRDSSKTLLQFYEALNDDFDTPRAIEILEKLTEDGVKQGDPNQIELYYESLKIASNILGVDLFGRHS